jgi:uncharacterized protein YchJ
MSDEKHLYKMRIDGEEKTKLNERASYEVNVSDDWIFYHDADDGGSLYKMRTDGTEVTLLKDDYCKYVNIAGDWVYYDGSKTPGTYELYRIRKDGSDWEKVE